MHDDRDLVVVVRFNDTLRVSWADTSPLPRKIYEDLARHMSYTHVTYLSGYERQRARKSGERPVRLSRVDLFHYDESGRLVCMAGYAERILEYFEGLGMSVEYRLKGRWAEPPRPDCFTEDWRFVDREFQFRPFQRQVVRQVIDHCHARLGGIISAAPGFGKTAVFKVIARVLPRARIAIGVRGTALVGRTADDIQEFVPAVGRVGSGKRQVERVTVYSMDSLHYMDPDTDLFLGDEVHEHPTPKYFRLLANHAAVPLRFGFSANTDDRADGAWKALEGLYGRKLFDFSIKDVTATGSILPIRVVWSQYDTDVAIPENALDTTRRRTGIWAHEARNNKIVERVRSYSDDDQILILCRTTEHVIRLHNLLPDFQPIFSGMSAEDREWYERKKLLPAGFVPPSKSDLDRLRRDFETGKLRRAIATMTWRQGISPNGLAVLVWAAGGSSKIDTTQGPSRAIRRDEATGKAFGIVEDLYDRFDPEFAGQSAKRHGHYAEYGWEQVDESGSAFELSIR